MGFQSKIWNIDLKTAGHWRVGIEIMPNAEVVYCTVWRDAVKLLSRTHPLFATGIRQPIALDCMNGFLIKIGLIKDDEYGLEVHHEGQLIHPNAAHVFIAD